MKLYEELTFMIYYVDIDDTVFKVPYKGSTEYVKHAPITERIDHFNNLFDKGHEIHYFTARGSRSKIDWFDLTEKQLLDAGAKFTSLNVGNKPHFDVLIDDKAINAESYFLIHGIKGTI